MTGSHLVYVANNYKDATNLMLAIENILHMNKSVELFSSYEMVKYLRQPGGMGVGGVVFQQDHHKLIATIRVDAAKIEKHQWNTKYLYSWLVKQKCRDESSSTGGNVPGYIKTGFTSIQSALSIAYVRQMGAVVDIPEIALRRFPHPPYTVRRALRVHKIILNVETLVGFYFICLYNVKVKVINTPKIL